MPSGAWETPEGEGLCLSWTHPLDYSDSGIYECVAVNEEGKSIASVNMTVVCECGREGGIEGEKEGERVKRMESREGRREGEREREGEWRKKESSDNQS